jgi:uncharacterized protein (TIGR01777 family)
MKFVLAGGSGQIGRILKTHFEAQGHAVVILGRNGGPGVVAWDGRTLGPWVRELEGADVVINLAGKSVNCRFTAANKRVLMDSRVDSTRAVGLAIARAERPPKVWLQMSTAAQYAHRYGDQPPHDEAMGILGGAEADVPRTWDFSVDIAKAWEKALFEADTPRTRKVALRAAIVLSPGRGGIFNIFLNLTRLGLAGPIAGGRQMISWIHREDFLRAVDFLVAKEDLSGPVIIGSPNPVTQSGFVAALRKAWGMPIGLPATKWMMEIAAWVLRTESELTLKSRHSYPGRLTRAGFTFLFPTWPEAARALVAEARNPRTAR